MSLEEIPMVWRALALIAAMGLFALGLWLGRIIGRTQRAKIARDGSWNAQKGQLIEQWVPLARQFPGEVADAKFLGAPIDYIVYKGLSRGAVTEVVFVEVKSGDSKLSPVQRSIRDCVQNKKVRWEVVRVRPESR